MCLGTVRWSLLATAEFCGEAARGRPRGSEGRSQSADASQNFQKIGAQSVARPDAQSGDIARPDQLCRHDEQAMAEALQGGSLQTRWTTEALEPIQQVVSQQDDLEECLVGLEVPGRNLSQSIGVLQRLQLRGETNAPIARGRAPYKIAGL